MNRSNQSSRLFQPIARKFPHRGVPAQHLLRRPDPANGIEVKPAALENGLFETGSVHAPFSGRSVNFIKIGGLP